MNLHYLESFPIIYVCNFIGYIDFPVILMCSCQNDHGTIEFLAVCISLVGCMLFFFILDILAFSYIESLWKMTKYVLIMAG
jgi:hypothetical protein